MTYSENFMITEEKLNLFYREVDNVKYWQLLRNYIYEKCEDKRCSFDKRHPDFDNAYQNIITGFFSLLKNSICYYSDYNQMQGSFLFSLCHRKSIDGMAYDPVCSEIIESEQNKTCILDRPFLFEHFYTKKPQNVIYSDAIDLKRSVFIKLYQWFCASLRIKCNREIDFWYDEIADALSCKLEKKEICDRLIYLLVTDKVLTAYFYHILKKNPPKCIIVKVHYDSFNFILIKIAHQLNIPVIELQHGYISPDHIAYNYSKKYDLYFPDRILMFGQYWIDSIKYPQKEKLIACGYPTFEKNIKKYKNYKKNNTILFISQGPFSCRLLALAEELFNLLKDMRLESEYHIVYKLHPNEEKNWFNEHESKDISGIEIMTQKDSELHFIMSQAIVQVGVNSTAIFEGFMFNLKTAIVNIRGLSPDMQELCSNGYAELVNNADELYSVILDREIRIPRGDYFWERNALEKILGEIEKGF